MSVAKAALRSLLLIGAVLAAMTLFKSPEYPMFALLAIPVIALLFIATLTPNRQAAHDYLVRSIVVTKSALKSPEDRDRLRADVAGEGSKTKRRPSFLRIASALLVIGIPIFVLYNVALIQLDRELRHRISYALGGTAGLRIALQELYLLDDRWGTSAKELDHPTRDDYPDGGYYELEKDGVIRIRFTVIPKLKKVSITMTPTKTEEGFDWECRAEGDIVQAILPSVCRD